MSVLDVRVVPVPIFSRWLYAGFVAIDANFRLKRRAVSNDEVDPSLSRGWAYFVEELSYKLYLREHAHTRQEVCVLNFHHHWPRHR